LHNIFKANLLQKSEAHAPENGLKQYCSINGFLKSSLKLSMLSYIALTNDRVYLLDFLLLTSLNTAN